MKFSALAIIVAVAGYRMIKYPRRSLFISHHEGLGSALDASYASADSQMSAAINPPPAE